MSETGESVEAVPWLIRAAENGHRYSQRQLGILYLQGRGVEKNRVQAYIWFERFLQQPGEDGWDENVEMYKNQALSQMTPAEREKVRQLVSDVVN